jgi:hypothetical protein
MAEGFDRIAMISDLDIWRAANLLIGQHGDEAELAAARRADLMHAALWATVWTFGPSLNAAISKGKPFGGSGGDVELQTPPTGPVH